MWKKSKKIKVNHSQKDFHLIFLDYLMSDAWTKIKASSSSLNISMDNVMEGIKRLVTEENDFESRVRPKTTQFFVFFWTYWNLMQETISKIAQLIRLLTVRGSCLKPWWMKSTFYFGSIQETWTKKFTADATKHLTFQSFCSPERRIFFDWDLAGRKIVCCYGKLYLFERDLFLPILFFLSISTPTPKRYSTILSLADFQLLKTADWEVDGGNRGTIQRETGFRIWRFVTSFQQNFTHPVYDNSDGISKFVFLLAKTAPHINHAGRSEACSQSRNFFEERDQWKKLAVLGIIRQSNLDAR